MCQLILTSLLSCILGCLSSEEENKLVVAAIGFSQGPRGSVLCSGQPTEALLIS